MIIAGAGAAGKETLYGLISDRNENQIVFFDENNAISTFHFLNLQFQVINKLSEVAEHFNSDNRFLTCIGHPRIKKNITEKLIQQGGQLDQFISNAATIIDNASINKGSIVHPGCIISFNTIIGQSVSIHANTTIGHGVKIGDYAMIGPNCAIIGPSEIGRGCYIGAGVTIINGVKIGDNVIVSAGSTVKTDLPSNSTFPM
jgi:sugar O-acyltransferase (sialic acid O-acetyltransferase NeuD family)